MPVENELCFAITGELLCILIWFELLFKVYLFQSFVIIEKELIMMDWFVLDWRVLKGKILFWNLSILSLMLCFHIIQQGQEKNLRDCN
jgi:hypothetical protein